MDDEEIVLRLLDRILSKTGYEAALAKNGAEAIELYLAAEKSGAPFDAVILDLIMPDEMGGKEVMEKLLEINPKVKAIISSGYVNESAMPNFKDYGFMAMVSKPYDIRKMLEALHDILNKNVRPVFSPDLK
jgi:CheY-like chemotaxis protein